MGRAGDRRGVVGHQEAVSVDLPALLHDPVEFIPRLKIVDVGGKVRTFGSPFVEQVHMLRAWLDPMRRQSLVVKSRQIGCGTARQAYDFWYTYRCPDVVNTLVVTHEQEAMWRHAARYRQFYDTLPKPLQRATERDTKTDLFFKGRDGAPGSGMKCITAGGKGGGKAFTFQRAHFTELAYYGSEAQSVYGSVKGAIHPSEHYSLCVESTPNGPDNFFAELAEMVQRDPEWRFLFFPWTMHAEYAVQPPPKFAESLTDEERRMMQRPVLFYGSDGEATLPPPTLAQIAWRRRQVAEKGLTRFRYDYPMTVEEAFASAGTSYFPPEVLAEWLAAAGPTHIDRRVFDRPRADTKYAIGVDVGQGLGRDWSVIQVLDHRGNQVAVWSGNRTPPHAVGEIAVEMAVEYGHAVLLIEANGPGVMALQRARQLGYQNLWTEAGKDFTTWGNQHSHAKGQGKHLVFGHARKALLERTCSIRDRLTLSELLNIREDARGRIGGGDKKNDDHAMAWVLAMWALRRVADYAFDAAAQMSARFGLNSGPTFRPTHSW